jgi:hypothetical protein
MTAMAMVSCRGRWPRPSSVASSASPESSVSLCLRSPSASRRARTMTTAATIPAATSARSAHPIQVCPDVNDQRGNPRSVRPRMVEPAESMSAIAPAMAATCCRGPRARPDRLRTDTITQSSDFRACFPPAAGFLVRPARLSASRNRNSICPFSERKSSLAQRWTASSTSGSIRMRNDFRSATARSAAIRRRSFRHSRSVALNAHCRAQRAGCSPSVPCAPRREPRYPSGRGVRARSPPCPLRPRQS